MKLDLNLFYATAKPGSYDYSDTATLRAQLFPLTFCIVHEYFELF